MSLLPFLVALAVFPLFFAVASWLAAESPRDNYLAQLKVGSKRVQIPHGWQETGCFGWIGQWMPTGALNQSRALAGTRGWTADLSSGTASKNQAICIERSESVAFSMGCTPTAFIPEGQAARFRAARLRLPADDPALRLYGTNRVFPKSSP